MDNYVISLIRTWVPILIGYVLTFIAESTGVVLDDNSKVSLTAFCVAVLSGLYYAIVRLLERKWPQLGWLLGMPAKLHYGSSISNEPPVGSTSG